MAHTARDQRLQEIVGEGREQEQDERQEGDQQPAGGHQPEGQALARDRERPERGHDVRLFLPFYGNLKERNRPFRTVDFVRDVPIRFGDRVYSFSLLSTTLPGTDLSIYLVVCPALYGREATYTADSDEHLRFAMLSTTCR